MIKTITTMSGHTPKKWAIFALGLYFIVLMHYFQFNHGGSGLNHPMNPLGWIIVSLVIACGLWKIANSGRFKFNFLSRNIAIAYVLLLIPLFYSGDTAWYSHQRLLGLFAGLAFLFAIQQLEFNRKDYFRLFNFIIVAALIESTLGLIQYYVLPSYPQLNIVTTRPAALLFQPNVAASFFVIGAALSLVTLQRKVKSNNPLKYLCFACTFTCTLAVVLLQSRTGFISSIVVTILLLSYHSSVNKKWLAIVLLGITIGIISINSTDNFSRSSDVYSHPGVRAQIYSDSLELIAKEPLLGHGYGTFIPRYLEQQAVKLALGSSPESYLPAYKMNHPHNEVLLWVVEGGLISLLAILLIFITLCKTLYQARRQTLLSAALLFPLALHTLTEFPFYQSVATWIIFIILCSFTQSKTKSISLSTSKTSIYQVSAVLLVFITSIYMLSMLTSQYRTSVATDDPNSTILLNSAQPFVSDSFIEQQNQQKLVISLQRGIDSEVRYYLSWAKSMNNVAPRPNRFSNRLLAALYLKDLKLADEILSQAKYLYPTLEWTKQTQWIVARKNQISRTNPPAVTVN